MTEDEDFNYEFDYLKDFVSAYLKKVDPSGTYYCKESNSSFIWINATNYLLCEKKDFTDSIFFAEIQIDWNPIQFFASIKKDSFKKLNIQELREYIGANLASMQSIKNMLKLKKPVDTDEDY